MIVGYLTYPLDITQMDRILTCATKGITNKTSPSQSDLTNFYLSNLLSYYLRMDFPLPATY
jgi:hypothetical protein